VRSLLVAASTLGVPFLLQHANRISSVRWRLLEVEECLLLRSSCCCVVSRFLWVTIPHETVTCRVKLELLLQLLLRHVESLVLVHTASRRLYLLVVFQV